MLLLKRQRVPGRNEAEQLPKSAIGALQHFPGGPAVKNLPAKAGYSLDLWVRMIPGRRQWLPSPVFLPGESQGQRSLVGYSPWGQKESDSTEQLNNNKFTSLPERSSSEVRGKALCLLAPHFPFVQVRIQYHGLSLVLTFGLDRFYKCMYLYIQPYIGLAKKFVRVFP